MKRNTGRSASQSLRLVSDRPQESWQRQALSDVQLVQALRAGDSDAPGLLWERYAPAVRRLLARTLGPSLELEDLTQEVFLRLFVRLPSLRDASALRPFTLSIAGNVLKWELRRRWISRRVKVSETGMLPDMEATPDDVEARQALRRCYAIFDTLTAKERIAFTVRYIEGMTAEEVAATLSVSVSTAKRWINRAAAKVAKSVATDPGLHHFFTVQGDKEPRGL